VLLFFKTVLKHRLKNTNADSNKTNSNFYRKAGSFAKVISRHREKTQIAKELKIIIGKATKENTNNNRS